VAVESSLLEMRLKRASTESSLCKRPCQRSPRCCWRLRTKCAIRNRKSSYQFFQRKQSGPPKSLTDTPATLWWYKH
jgi:hypothetical protein